MLNHDYIGTEHILLGLIHEGEGVAAKVLESLGISLAAVRQQVEEIIGPGQQAPSGHIPFTPRAKEVLELAQREARALGHDYMGTEHILLGLIREGGGVAAQVLVKLGADLNRVRQQVIQLLQGYQGTESLGAGSRRGKRARARLLDDALARIDSLDRRLAAIEHWSGLRPDLDDLCPGDHAGAAGEGSSDRPAGFRGRRRAARQGDAIARRPRRPGEGVDGDRC